MGLHHAPLFLFIILGSSLQTRQDHPPITVESCQHTNALLECNCSERAVDLKWQINSTLKYSENSTTQSNKSAHRIKTFRNENRQNCSLLLENITEEDDGDYSCIFKDKGKYSKSRVTLNVNTNSTECSAHGTTPQSVQGSSPDRPETYFAFLIIILAFLLFGCILIVLRKRRRKLLCNKRPSEATSVIVKSCEHLVLVGSPGLPEIN